MCIKELQDYVQAFQERRAKVTDEVVEQFMALRPLKWASNPNAVTVVSTTAVQPDGAAAGAAAGEGDGGDVKLTKNQLKKLQKERQIAEKKAQKLKGQGAGAGESSGAPE